MPEVKIEKPEPLARQTTRGVNFDDRFTPGFPLERLFGMSPFATMRGFTDEMDRMFHGQGSAFKTWAPAVDVQRCNGNLVVTAELPGLKKEEVKVTVTEIALTIEGERKQEHREDHEGYHRYERNYGTFYRAIPLPEGALGDQAKAELINGVLKITIPAPEAKTKVREIAVEEKNPAA